MPVGRETTLKDDSTNGPKHSSSQAPRTRAPRSRYRESIRSSAPRPRLAGEGSYAQLRASPRRLPGRLRFAATRPSRLARLRAAARASSEELPGAREAPSQEVFHEGHVDPNLPRFC